MIMKKILNILIFLAALSSKAMINENQSNAQEAQAYQKQYEDWKQVNNFVKEETDFRKLVANSREQELSAILCDMNTSLFAIEDAELERKLLLQESIKKLPNEELTPRCDIQEEEDAEWSKIMYQQFNEHSFIDLAEFNHEQKQQTQRSAFGRTETVARNDLELEIMCELNQLQRFFYEINNFQKEEESAREEILFLEIMLFNMINPEIQATIIEEQNLQEMMEEEEEAALIAHLAQRNFRS